MTTDQIIALFASIAACLTAIASFIVLLQNYKQRQASYRPEIVLKKITFETTECDSKLIPKDWFSQDYKPQNSFFALPIVNIGLGTAKQIKATWFFDFKTYINEINKSAQEALIPAYFEYENEVLNFKSDLDSAIHFWSNQKYQEIDYILPISIDGNPAELFFPKAIIFAITSDCFFWLQKDDRKKIDFPVFPKIELQLCYYDIGNKKHCEKFEIKIELSVVKGERNSPCSFEGFIKSERKNN